MNLDKFQYLYDRVQLGIDVHPSDIEIEEMQAIAKEIDPTKKFFTGGCVDCANELVKFIFQQ